MSGHFPSETACISISISWSGEYSLSEVGQCPESPSLPYFSLVVI